MNDIFLTEEIAEEIADIFDYEYSPDMIALVHSALTLTPKFKEMFLFGAKGYGIDMIDDNYILSSCEVAISFRICLFCLYGNMFVLPMQSEGVYIPQDVNNILETFKSIDLGISFLTDKLRIDTFNSDPLDDKPLLMPDLYLECEYADYILQNAIDQSEIMFKPFSIEKIKIKEGKKPEKLSNIENTKDPMKNFNYFFKLIEERIYGKKQK